MLEWVCWAADRVDELAKSDVEYRESAQKQESLVDAFEAMLEKLPEDDKELLLDYMEAEGDMAYRKCQIAYEFGKQVGRNQVKI